MTTRTPRRAGAWILAAGSALAGCGSEEMFTLQLASTEQLIDRAAAARLSHPEGWLEQAVVVGDLDGDGIDDAVVRTQVLNWRNPSTLRADSPLYVIYGGSQVTGALDSAALPTLTKAGVGVNAVAAVGDVDGDGLADFLAESHPSECGSGQFYGAYLVYGSATRLAGSRPIADVATSLRDADSCADHAIAALGDLDGDGKAEFAITRGPNFMDSPPAETADAFVFYGRGARLSGVLDLGPTADAVIRVPGVVPQPIVVPAGDLDGDGLADLIIGTRTTWFAGPQLTNPPVVNLRAVRGSATRLAGTVAIGDVASTQLPSTTCPTSFVGQPVAAALGDLDGDGADDFSLTDCQRIAGSVSDTVTHHVYYGRKGGLPAAFGVADAAATVATGAPPVNWYSFSQLIAADLDGDGRRELIVTDQGLHDGNGGVHLIRGSATRFSGSLDAAAAGFTTYVGTPQRLPVCTGSNSECVRPEQVGRGVSVGDVTGDHHPDLVVAAGKDFAFFDNSQGRVFSSTSTYVIPGK